MSALALLAATGTNAPTYVDDVFSTYLYTGNGSTQTITNGIDLAGKGGLVWIKERGASFGHYLADTDRGNQSYLKTFDTTAAQTGVTDRITSFASTGYALGANAATNSSSLSYASWTFRKAAKFFDCGTYTGDGVAGRTVNHNLGAVPGMIIVKMVDGADVWGVYHRSLGNTQQIQLQSTGTPFTSSGYWNNTDPTATQFTVGTSASVNTSGKTYVYYAFAHDTTTDGLIQCGTYTGNGSATGPTITLGWEPQFVMIKQTTAASATNWEMFDSMRGLCVGGAGDSSLRANLSNAEVTATEYIDPTATGFQVTTSGGAVNAASGTYIYLAIRRPNKPPTSGTQVYNAIARTGTGAAATVTGVGFAPDLLMTVLRTSPQGCATIVDRLRGPTPVLLSSNTAAENTTYATTEVQSFEMDGFKVGTSSAANWFNNSGSSLINWFFRRAPGVFDVVCYTGNGTAGRVLAHGLGVAPEFVIIKGRTTNTGGNHWATYNSAVSPSHGYLNLTNAYNTLNWIGSPTATTITIGTANTNTVNENSQTYVAYLFATKAGISKVGSYTGNGGTAGTSGSSQNLDFGFSAGARFVMIKATNATGDWFVWDSTRGIVASTDPRLSLNTAAAEVTTDDSVDPLNAGITVNQLAATDINVTGRTYLVLAFA